MNLLTSLLYLWLVVAFFSSFSYVWRGNPLFMFVTNLILGAGAGHYVVLQVRTLSTATIDIVSKAKYVDLIVILIAALMFATLLPYNFRWLTRYPTAIMTGSGLALTMRAILQTQVIGQIVSAIRPITTPDMATNLGNFLFMTVLSASLFYFMFGFELKGPWLKVNKFARFLIYVAFGVAAGGQFFGDSVVGVGTFLELFSNMGGFLDNLR